MGCLAVVEQRALGSVIARNASPGHNLLELARSCFDLEPIGIFRRSHAASACLVFVQEVLLLATSAFAPVHDTLHQHLVELYGCTLLLRTGNGTGSMFLVLDRSVFEWDVTFTVGPSERWSRSRRAREAFSSVSRQSWPQQYVNIALECTSWRLWDLSKLAWQWHCRQWAVRFSLGLLMHSQTRRCLSLNDWFLRFQIWTFLIDVNIRVHFRAG